MTKNLVAAIEHYEQGAQSGSLMEARSDAIDRYLGRPYGDEVPGRSQVVMRDVADTVEWIKPSLLKVFAAGEEVCKFDPVGPEDEQGAEQETEYINRVLMQKNNGFMVFHDWFHDALLQKNGYVVCNWATESRAQLSRYSKLSDDEFALVTMAEDVEIVEHAEEIEMLPDGSSDRRHSVAVRQTKEVGYPKVICVPPERVHVAADWPDIDLRECPFVSIVEYPSISDLREEGFDVADDIQDEASTADDEWETQRRDSELEGSIDRDGLEATPEMRRVKVRRVWIRFDADGDGIAELRRVRICGVTIFEDEEDDLIPVACLTPNRQPHDHHGLSVADVVDDLQRIRTVLVRGFLDSMYLANSPRNAVDVTKVNIDDLRTSRVGGIVRVQGDPSGAIMPLVQAHQGPAILQAIEYVDTVRENRTGVTSYNQGLDANSLNKTATGVSQIMQAAAQRIDMIARVFAETGVKALMLIIHAVAQKHSRQAELIRVRDEWIPIDPRAWKTRHDMTVSVGIGTGNKDQMLAHLMMILQEQKQAMAIGLTRPEQIYTTLSKLTQNAGFKMAEQFWSDPRKFQPPPQPPNPEMLKIQAEQQKTQFQAQQDQMKFQAESQLERERMAMQAELDRNRQEWEARQKQLEMQQQAQVDAMNAEHQRELEAARLELDRWKAALDSQTRLAIADKATPPPVDIAPIQAALQEMAGSKPVSMERIRDQSGKLIGVRRKLANGKTEEVAIQ